MRPLLSQGRAGVDPSCPRGEQTVLNLCVEMTNRFKRLDLVDRMPEELWMEICNTVQEVVTKTIPKKQICM